MVLDYLYPTIPILLSNWLKKNPKADPALRSTVESNSGSTSSSSEEEISPPAPTLPTTDMKSTVDSGSESDDFNRPLKSIVSKPTNNASKLKWRRSRPNSEPNVSPSSIITPMKRPTAETVGKDSKKPKTVKASRGGEEEKKPTLFQRLWSDDDEVAILKGSDPLEDAIGFHEFVKNSVHVNVDPVQFAKLSRPLNPAMRYIF